MSAFAGSGGVVVGMAGTSSGGGGDSTGCNPVACTLNQYGFAFTDSYYLAGCSEVQGPECLLVQGACPNLHADDIAFEDSGYLSREEFKLGGEAGKFYDVTIRVNGIVEGKYYRYGTRRRGDDFSDANAFTGSDTFYVGGEPIPSTYGVYKLSVFQPDGSTELEHYYLNSFPMQSGFESHQTFPIGYEAVIQVPGQGVIKRLYQDSNCRAYNNCGPGDNGASCPAARNVPNEPGLQVPPMHGGVSTASLNVINGATQPFHAQIIHITVTNVQLAP